VVLAWAERQGPAVVPPQRKGLGTKLIQRGLPDATIDWRFDVPSIFQLPSRNPRTAAPLALTYKLT
jgi:hypothetical protein